MDILRVAVLTLLSTLATSIGFAAAARPVAVAPQANEAVEQPTADQELTSSERLPQEQEKLAQRYKLLEEKLFSLYEFEQDSNPGRSQLLQKAFQQSQANSTAQAMHQIAEFLSLSKLKNAEQEQQQVLAELNQLLVLLQSEDRGKRVQDEIKRNQEYLKEVERILRMQKGIRGQAEGGVDSRRLGNSQAKAAQRAGRLAGEIRENEEDPSPDNLENNDGSSDTDPNPADDENEDPTNDLEQNPAQNGSEDQPSKNDAAPSEGESSEGEPKSGQSDSPAGNQGSPSPGEPGSPAGGESEDSQSSPPPESADENPVRKRIEAAQQRMQDAQQKLEDAKRDDSIEDMKQAERELAAAKLELEEILRQLREEEIERTLAMLEGRFRQMLEREIRVQDATQKFHQLPAAERGPDFEIQTGKLSIEQNAIATEAGRALLLLREDGSSVAFPATVEEVQQDMLQVASRLSASKVGQITLEIEEDIIETLDYIVKALIQTQQDMAKMKQGPPQKGGPPGDKPLVDQLAEIKMLRSLQQRIHKRHQRYSRLLEDPNDPLGATDEPDMRAALDRLADRQAQLTDIARDIVSGKNQ